MARTQILKSAGAAACAVLALATLAGCADNSGPDNKIQVTRALYGYLAGRKDVMSVVGPMCNGQSRCSFSVENKTFAAVPPLDPNPGEDKSGILAWKCGDGSEHSYEFAEGKTAKMTCPSDVRKSGCQPGMVQCQTAPGA